MMTTWLSIVLLTSAPAPQTAAYADIRAIPIPAETAVLEARAEAINNHGKAVGLLRFSAPSPNVGWYWDGERLILVAAPGADDTYLWDINDSGVAVGHASFRDQNHNILWDRPFAWHPESGFRFLQIAAPHRSGVALTIGNDGLIGGHLGLKAALWEGESVRILPSPQSGEWGGTRIVGMNDSSTLIGDYGEDVGVWGYTYRDDTGWTYVGSGVEPTGIDDSGTVCGVAGLRGHYWQRPVVWEPGWSRHQYLPGFGLSSLGRAYGMNRHGDIVGTTHGSGWEWAALWKQRQLYLLQDLIPPDSGWRLTRADSINDSGQILGIGTFNGVRMPFILTPR